jgi:spermidine synthase
VLASKGRHPAAAGREEIDRMVRERVQGQLRYYDGETHTMMFALPKHVRESLAAETRVIEDNHPLFAFR